VVTSAGSLWYGCRRADLPSDAEGRRRRRAWRPMAARRRRRRLAGLAILLGAAVVLLQLRHDDGPGWSRLVGLESDSCRRLEGRTPGRNTVVSG
jgi:hypothetical protein